MKTWFLAVLVIPAFLQWGCAEKNAHSENQGEPSERRSDTTKVEDKEKKEEPEKVPVEVTTLGKGTISSYLLLSSNLETEEMADVYARIQGLVARIYVEEGDYVKKGQILLELEADEYALAEEKARVNFQKQQKAFERAQAMYQKELLSIEEFEQTKFAYEGAKIEWEQAKLNLNYTRVRAPISGVIGDRLIRPGQRIQPQDKLFTVINPREMIAVVYVPEKEIQTVHKGQKAFITSEHVPEKRFPGWVKRVSPVVDPQSGTFKVTIGVKNPNHLLRPGMFVNVHIITETHENAVLVPKLAIVYENELMYVFVVREGIAHKIRVAPGFQDHQYVEALQDLAAGDTVIVVGQAGLKDQTPVKVVLEREYDRL